MDFFFFFFLTLFVKHLPGLYIYIYRNCALVSHLSTQPFPPLYFLVSSIFLSFVPKNTPLHRRLYVYTSFDDARFDASNMNGGDCIIGRWLEFINFRPFHLSFTPSEFQSSSSFFKIFPEFFSFQKFFEQKQFQIRSTTFSLS